MFRTKCKEHDHSSFYKFLQMEQSQKNTDCYFFYYSTCMKGDNCAFRHEPSALGCETMCSYWQQGNCLNEHCNFRHMELKKNRKSIPCYWETQPSGCRKPHCSFMHKNARTITSDPINPVKTSDLTSKPINQEWSNRQDEGKYDGSSTESDQGRGSSEAGSFIGSPAVDPLIVNFEEESDNESVPSPVKPQTRVPYCKTYEEIRLEQIQAESAAYYSYEPDDYLGNAGGGKAKRTFRGRRSICLYARDKKADGAATKYDGFPLLSLDEIRKRRGLMEASSRLETNDGQANTLNVAIKTLAELRASKTLLSIKGSKRPREKNLEGDDEGGEQDRRVKFKGEVEPGLASKVVPVQLRRLSKKNTGSCSQRDTSDGRFGTLDFEVLSLDEIRKRMRLAEASKRLGSTGINDGNEDGRSGTSNIKIKTLAELRASRIVSSSLTSRDSSGPCDASVLKDDGRGEQDRRVDCKGNVNSGCVKVPPVRLRRSPKKVATRPDQESIGSCSQPTDSDGRGDTDQPADRLASESFGEFEQNRSQDERSAGRLNDVEVRLCDSSTDDKRDDCEDEAVEKVSALLETKDDTCLGDERDKNDDDYDDASERKGESKFTSQICDSLLNISDDDCLTLDAAADDILKDIDALLKEKTVV